MSWVATDVVVGVTAGDLDVILSSLFAGGNGRPPTLLLEPCGGTPPG